MAASPHLKSLGDRQAPYGRDLSLSFKVVEEMLPLFISLEFRQVASSFRDEMGSLKYRRP